MPKTYILGRIKYKKVYLITLIIFSPLKPTIQKIITGKLAIIEIEINKCKELKIKLKIKNIREHQITQKIAVE